MHKIKTFQEIQEKRKQQKQNALKKLLELKQNKMELKRPVFFVPGWTDEGNACWQEPYQERYTPIKDWLTEIKINHNLAEYITFTDDESKNCNSFINFASIIKDKIWAKVDKNKIYDIVGHSMGGLDIVTAIADKENPLLNVNNCITVATPHRGSEWGEIAPKIKKYKPHHAIQCINLDPDQPPIKLINKLVARQALLNRINKLYCLMGTRDMTVMQSARFNKEGLDPELYKKKVEIIEIGGATHSQKYGITQDPRTILAIVSILLDLELVRPKYNYGYTYKKVY